MLRAQGWSTELPSDVPRSTIDDDHGRDRAKTDDDVPVRQLRKTVPVGPFIPPLLDRRDPFGCGIQMLPTLPLLYSLTIGGHLDQIVGIHLAVVFCSWHSTYDLRRKPLGK